MGKIYCSYFWIRKQIQFIMNINEKITMSNSFKSMNIFKKLGLTLLLVMLLAYFALSIKFILS